MLRLFAQQSLDLPAVVMACMFAVSFNILELDAWETVVQRQYGYIDVHDINKQNVHSNNISMNI